MPGEKTVSVGFRVTPEFKQLLAIAALHDHRTMTSLLEKLLADHCRSNGLLLGETLPEPSSLTERPASRHSTTDVDET
jgi:hypothetical protein